MLALVALCALLLSGCGGAQKPEPQVDLSDPLSGEGILAASELIEFFERGTSDTATLAASISMDDEMLTLTKQRGPLTILGNGYTISGNGDCVIRLEDGCAITMDDLTLKAGASAIGCLGSATISGVELTIDGIANAVDAKGCVTIGEGSSVNISSSVGRAVSAAGLTVGKDASVTATGGLNAVDIASDDILLEEGAYLDATTKEDYNALKCTGALIMKDGSKLDVTNLGEYHGAEIGSLAVTGVATIHAKGGSKGVGIFLFEQNEDVRLIGSCTPDARFEVGSGSITFVETEAELKTPDPTEQPGASPSPGATGG